MRIHLHEITEQDTVLDFTQDESWVVQAVGRVDEHLEEIQKTAAPRPIQVHFALRKVDEVVVISGKINTYIELICSRCANPFHHSCDLRFSALFCKDPVLAGIAHLQRSTSEAQRPVGQNQGVARHAHESADSPSTESSQDLDITYLSQDYIELGEVLTEHLRLQIPFQPLCKEICKGICPNCGADLNIGRCACAKINQPQPFSVLRDFKV